MVTNTVGKHTGSIFKLEKALHYYYAEEAVAFSKTLATIDHNTQCHIPKDSSYYSEFQLGEWVYQCFPWSLNAKCQPTTFCCSSSSLLPHFFVSVLSFSIFYLEDEDSKFHYQNTHQHLLEDR
jgi:hypothetical protein